MSVDNPGPASAEIVAARLTGHEALCGERHKMIDKRFDDVDKRHGKIEKIIYSTASAIIGALFCALGTLLWKLWEIRDAIAAVPTS